MHFDTGELHCRMNFKEGQLKPEFMMLGGVCVCVGGVEVPFACTVLITKFPMHTEFLNLTGFDEVLMHYTIWITADKFHAWMSHSLTALFSWLVGGRTIVVVVISWSWIDRLQFSYSEYLNFLKSIKESFVVKNGHQKGTHYDEIKLCASEHRHHPSFKVEHTDQEDDPSYFHVIHTVQREREPSLALTSHCFLLHLICTPILNLTRNEHRISVFAIANRVRERENPQSHPTARMNVICGETVGKCPQ